MDPQPQQQQEAPMEIAAVVEPVPAPWFQHFTAFVSSIYFYLGLFIASSAILVYLSFFLKYHNHHSKQFPCDGKFTISIDGSAQFRTISEAVHAAQPYSVSRMCIVIGSGNYNETVMIPVEKTNLVLIGAGINSTKITYRYIFADSNRGVLNVHGRGFVAIDLTVANSANQSEGVDGVAVVNMAGESVFFRCGFIGFGKTLYALARNQFYRECQIEGSTYLVYGGAEAYFQLCNMKAARGDGETVMTGNTRVAKLDAAEFVFHMCTFGPVANVANSTIYLGASVTPYSRVVVMKSDLDGSVKGWKMDSTSPCTSDGYLAQYMNRGPGASNEPKQSSLPCMHSNISLPLAQELSLRNFFYYSWIPKYVPHQLDL